MIDMMQIACTVWVCDVCVAPVDLMEAMALLESRRKEQWPQNLRALAPGRFPLIGASEQREYRELCHIMSLVAE